MTIDYNRLRIEGVYKQDEDGHLMMRAKVPAGVLSAEQALKVCEIAETFSNGILHLSTRGSIEFHWLRYEDLASARRMMEAVGLTSRGACGGAVRGISCSSSFSPGFPVAQVMARKLHRHFAGNPRFEALPKKFKIGVDAGYASSRHLIQDIGLVYVGTEEGIDHYDVWSAGGLGREPMEGFLLEEHLPENRIIALIEAVVSVHKAHTPKGRRVKHLVRDIGETKFRKLIEEYRQEPSELELHDGFEKRLTALSQGAPEASVEAVVFAGEIETAVLRKLVPLARELAEGFMALTADQNIALLLSDPRRRPEAVEALAAIGLAGEASGSPSRFRICPGNHECRMGLAPTRDLARELGTAMNDPVRKLTWAISGCANSCAQPQLADVGILASKQTRDDEGRRHALFDLYRREGKGFGRPVRQGLSREELLQVVADLR